MTEQVKNGDTVRVHYTGRLEGGEVFDSSEGGDALDDTLKSIARKGLLLRQNQPDARPF